ncbi:hypothetical protein ADN00_16350 [Ornatilinea apprima]|uniref:HTH luxR-type domain-containing protein n=1 Tax=Ornatilinea apprima TaxID=1134406 RepID=A0A0P6WZ95_9CHLR|nr:LuxR C-terminal-related transcriptional regulator [Ornatilinea apprima]KPL72049.1 hypothetical protein ADN00_16350 [Ornatilinea apprima]
MNIRLLSTKFHTPAGRETGVPRQRLLERLNHGLAEQRKLSLVSAPVGYGKTTLVSDWCRSLGDTVSFGWVTLDDKENDPERFLCYWLALFQQMDEATREPIQILFTLPQFPPMTIVMDDLLNILADLPTRLVVVLDDYHLIHNPQIHDALDYFLDHLPSQVHLVVITRQDPPLSLARMRARGQMTEIRAHDLRFSTEEAQRFFAQSLKLHLSADVLETLEERTEGWAAGLQLAGLALQNQADPQRFIETFRGSHRYVLDFLAEEVIRQQKEDIRVFLAQTSVLERFNAASCAALTGRMDAQEVLNHLEQANLFLIALDDERIWYRYHPLFSDYLRTMLAKPEWVELNQKASAWHEANDLIVEAVQYALASGDLVFSAEAIERAMQEESVWSAGNLSLLTGWLDALPVSILQSRPQLNLDAAHLFYLAGRFEQAESRIAEAEQALQAGPTTQQGEQQLALASLYRGCIASVRGEVSQALELITHAKGRISPDHHMAHARALFNLGLVYEITEQLDQAVQHYLGSVVEAKLAGVRYFAVHGLCAAAQVQVMQGQLTTAEQSCQEAVQLLAGDQDPSLGLAYSILGAIALEKDQLDCCEEYLEKGLALSRKGGLLDDMIYALAQSIKLRVANRQYEEAKAFVQEIQSQMKPLGIPRITVMSEAILARIQLTSGDMQAAFQWAEQYLASRETSSHEFAELTLARILLAKKQWGLLEEILNPLLEKAEKSGRLLAQIEILMLIGRYHQARGDQEQSLAFLKKALDLARPQGLIRVFLDEGQPMLALLSKLPGLPDEISKRTRTTPKRPENQQDALVEPLSDQELRILRLVVAGKTNQEIAAVLYISVGTAKWHVHNIFQKMGVNNRAQAIARSRELNLF